MEAIKIIEDSIQTHKEWAEFFEANPECEHLEQFKHLGDAKYHRECIERYKKAIREIKELQNTYNLAIDNGLSPY